MIRRWLCVGACLLSIPSLFVTGTGALITSLRPVPAVVNSTPSATAVQQFASAHHLLLAVHGISADALVLLTVLFIICLVVGDERRWLHLLGLAALGGIVMESVPGQQAILGSAALAFFHAYIGHLFFSAILAIAVFTSKAWNSFDTIENRYGLRTLAILVPCLVLIQIALGAAYRHQFMGVLWHIFGAFIVAIFVLLAGVLTVKQYPQHRFLRPAAVTLMSIAGCQVLLGFAAFVIRLMTTTPTTPVVVITAAHVVTGTVTLGASIVFALGVMRTMCAAQDRPASLSQTAGDSPITA